MSGHVGLRKSVASNGDVTYTNIYDGSKQTIPKDEYDRRMKLTDKETEKEIDSDPRTKKDKKG